MSGWLVLILVFAGFVALAGFFAGAETGIYQLSRVRLRLGIEKNQFGFTALGRIVQDGPALLLSMILGNNLAHYLATSIATYLLLKRLEVAPGVVLQFFTQWEPAHSAELLATLITAPILFVFSEFIPKNIFFYRSDTLTPSVAPVLLVFHKFFTWCGAVTLLKNLSRFFATAAGIKAPSKTAVTTVQKHRIAAILQETHEEDFLSAIQTDIINRLVRTSNIPISTVMVPVNNIRMVDINTDRSALVETLKKSAFTRLPVFERHRANITGFVNIYEVLGLQGEFSDLRTFVKPIQRLADRTNVIDAISFMQKQKQKIVLVVKLGHTGRQRPVGIVTMKDLIEELIGELAEW
ncbi:MAG: DUF21 domain-containing protein [Sedimentisphaerales bacterium]|nr:DUF21 domain-containing protein [Sedimentisphaerales bacterium]